MPIISVADGETETVADGDTLDGGPVNVDGTLNLDGTLNAGEATIAAAALPGIVATGTADGEKDVRGSAALGLDTARPLFVADGEVWNVPAGVTDDYGPVNVDGALNLDGTLNVGGVSSTPSGEKATTGTAALGLTATGTADGEKGVRAAAALGLVATGTLDSLVPLFRVNSLDVSDDRTTDFDAQGVGDVDD